MQTTSGDQHEKFLHLIALGTTPIKPNVAQTTQVGSPDRLVKHANYFFLFFILQPGTPWKHLGRFSPSMRLATRSQSRRFLFISKFNQTEIWRQDFPEMLNMLNFQPNKCI